MISEERLRRLFRIMIGAAGIAIIIAIMFPDSLIAHRWAPVFGFLAKVKDFIGSWGMQLKALLVIAIIAILVFIGYWLVRLIINIAEEISYYLQLKKTNHDS